MELWHQHESIGADRSTTGPDRKINSRTPVELFYVHKVLCETGILMAQMGKNSSRNVVNVEKESNIIGFWRRHILATLWRQVQIVNTKKLLPK